MDRITLENRTLPNGMTLRLSIAPDFESPNDVYGIWEKVAGHEGGVTVQDQNGGYWTSCNYTPAELAKEYAAQGRENPSGEAYASLQRELWHYLYGCMWTVELVIEHEGYELARDCIGFDYSEWAAYQGQDAEDAGRETAREHFVARSLIREAREEAAKIAESLSKSAA